MNRTLLGLKGDILELREKRGLNREEEEKEEKEEKRGEKRRGEGRGGQGKIGRKERVVGNFASCHTHRPAALDEQSLSSHFLFTLHSPLPRRLNRGLSDEP